MKCFREVVKGLIFIFLCFFSTINNCKDILAYLPITEGVIFVDVDSSKKIRLKDSATGLAIFSGNGKRFGFRSRSESRLGRNFIVFDTSGEDFLSLRKLSEINGFKSRISCAAFSPDGSKLVFGFRNGYLEIRDVKTSNVIKSFRAHSAPVISVAFSNDGKKLVSGSTGGIRRIKIFNAGNWKLMLGIKLLYPVATLAFNYDGNALFARLGNGNISVFDLQNGGTPIKMLGLPEKNNNLLVVSNDGKKLAVNADSSVKVFDISNLQVEWPSREIPIDNFIERKGYEFLSFNHDGSRLAIGGLVENGTFIFRKIVIWNMQNWKEEQVIKTRTGGIHRLVFQPKDTLQKEIQKEQEEERLRFLQEKFLQWPAKKSTVSVKPGQVENVIVSSGLLVPTIREKTGIAQLIKNLRELRGRVGLEEFKLLTEDLFEVLKDLRKEQCEPVVRDQ